MSCCTVGLGSDHGGAARSGSRREPQLMIKPRHRKPSRGGGRKRRDRHPGNGQQQPGRRLGSGMTLQERYLRGRMLRAAVAQGRVIIGSPPLTGTVTGKVYATRVNSRRAPNALTENSGRINEAPASNDTESLASSDCDSYWEEVDMGVYDRKQLVVAERAERYMQRNPRERPWKQVYEQEGVVAGANATAEEADPTSRGSPFTFDDVNKPAPAPEPATAQANQVDPLGPPAQPKAAGGLPEEHMAARAAWEGVDRRDRRERYIVQDDVVLVRRLVRRKGPPAKQLYGEDQYKRRPPEDQVVMAPPTPSAERERPRQLREEGPLPLGEKSAKGSSESSAAKCREWADSCIRDGCEADAEAGVANLSGAEETGTEAMDRALEECQRYQPPGMPHIDPIDVEQQSRDVDKQLRDIEKLLIVLSSRLHSSAPRASEPTSKHRSSSCLQGTPSLPGASGSPPEPVSRVRNDAAYLEALEIIQQITADNDFLARQARAEMEAHEAHQRRLRESNDAAFELAYQRAMRSATYTDRQMRLQQEKDREIDRLVANLLRASGETAAVVDGVALPPPQPVTQLDPALMETRARTVESSSSSTPSDPPTVLHVASGGGIRSECREVGSEEPQAAGAGANCEPADVTPPEGQEDAKSEGSQKHLPRDSADQSSDATVGTNLDCQRLKQQWETLAEQCASRPPPGTQRRPMSTVLQPVEVQRHHRAATDEEITFTGQKWPLRRTSTKPLLVHRAEPNSSKAAEVPRFRGGSAATPKPLLDFARFEPKPQVNREWCDDASTRVPQNLAKRFSKELRDEVRSGFSCDEWQQVMAIVSGDIDAAFGGTATAGAAASPTAARQRRRSSAGTCAMGTAWKPTRAVAPRLNASRRSSIATQPARLADVRPEGTTAARRTTSGAPRQLRRSAHQATVRGPSPRKSGAASVPPLAPRPVKSKPPEAAPARKVAPSPTLKASPKSSCPRRNLNQPPKASSGGPAAPPAPAVLPTAKPVTAATIEVRSPQSAPTSVPTVVPPASPASQQWAAPSNAPVNPSAVVPAHVVAKPAAAEPSAAAKRTAPARRISVSDIIDSTATPMAQRVGVKDSDDDSDED